MTILYVDDLFLTGDEQLIDQCKRELTFEFEMKDLGLMHYLVGLEVWQKQANARRDLPDTMKVCSRYLAEIWDARLQVHERTNDYQLDKVAGFSHQFTECGLYFV